jgi:Uma2 family endonuclease
MAVTEAPKTRTEDHFVTLHDISWSQYEMILAIRGDQPGVRMTYLEGELELMSPSFDHERIKTMLARLLEAFAEERELPLNGYGSWTVRKALRARGLEPDECYVLGTHEPKRPDLAIEVVWTSGGIDKLEVYRGLGVPEVWRWRGGELEAWLLRGERYELGARSQLLPDVDLARLAALAQAEDQTAAVAAFRKELRAAPGG